MRLKLMMPGIALAVCVFANRATAQGTVFTYQALLQQNGLPAIGTYNFRFHLVDQFTNCAGTNCNPVMITNVSITNGLFTVPVDFGAGAFLGGMPVWLQIEVATNGATNYVSLAPLQQVTAPPYAQYSLNAGVAGVANATSPSSLIQGAGLLVGVNNGMLALYSSILGGSNNSATGMLSVIGGGADNSASGNYAEVAGGFHNIAGGDYSFVGGGGYNTAKRFDVVGGGESNFVGADLSGIFSGLNNSISETTGSSLEGFIGGGEYNGITGTAANSVISGGYYNTNEAAQSVIDGGGGNTIQTGAGNSVIDGGGGNTIETGAGDSVIGGGGPNWIGTNAVLSTIGGGSSNFIYGVGCTIAGGRGLIIQTNVQWAAIGGGNNNTASADGSFIGGGQNNLVDFEAIGALVAGGDNNTIQSFANDSVIAGGSENTILTTNGGSAILGGNYNTNGGVQSIIVGGFGNAIQGNADQDVIGGGAGNRILASGADATIPGGSGNVAGGFCSFAAGNDAQATDSGSFVWADSTGGSFSSTANNQFLIRAAGGVGINTNAPQQALSIAGGLNVDQGDQNTGGVPGNALTFGNNSGEGIASKRTGMGTQFDLEFYTEFAQRMVILQNGDVGVGTASPAHLFQVGNAMPPAYCEGTTWVNGSDRNAKRDFATVDPGEVLQRVSALPITEWQYKAEAAGNRHIGPMAQDFHQAFGLNGADDTHIATVDEEGVALAAIQGLNQKVEDQAAQLKDRDAKIGQLESRLERIEQLLGQQNGGAK